MTVYRKGVTVVIPSIPPRVRTILPRAMDSVFRQERQVDGISLAIDHDHEGAAVTRNRALKGVTTEWTAFLDDDDTLRPGHIGSLLEAAEASGADLVYPWFTVPSGFDPWPEREGQPFNRELLKTMNYIPVTVLARTKLLHEVGGFRPKGPPENPCDDWGCWDALLEAGAKFHHLNKRTWFWMWHSWYGGNTSGRGDRW